MWKRRKKNLSTFNAEKVFLAAGQPLAAVFNYFQTSSDGLDSAEVARRQSLYGKNEVEHERRENPLTMFVKAFINPFIGVLTGLVVISYLLDVYLAEPAEQDWTAIIIISTMVVLSAILRFWQEWKASVSSAALQRMVTNTCAVKRAGREAEEIGIDDLVPGDLVLLSAGDMVPADLRIVESKDLFISQASLTGESESIEKHPEVQGKRFRKGSVVELDNICYMGSNVVSGAATGIVFATAGDTYLGTIAKSIAGHRATTAFDRGIAKVSMLLIRFMLVMVPFVFLVNGLTKGDWLDAFLFAVSVAVGLTPEMLPMIVTANLSKGAVAMSRKKTIVKDLNAIQNFGAMNILCTDKTG
ncbi:MAG: HAD-IC family P-type ATPase, partial [Alistipes sp.]|nr:HAD-IC family P-type ATPase [Alistipes sp.]